MLTVLTTLALLAPTDASARAGDQRTVKVDLFSYGQALHPYGSDWEPSLLDIWSGVLDCEEVRLDVEHCTAHGGNLWYGIVPAQDQAALFQRIPFEGTIELQWTPSGRLKSYDVQGDRESFWQVGSNALLELHRLNLAFKPDSVRRVGKDLELSLTRGIASALEIDRERTDKPTWKTKKPLWAGRRYSGAVGIGRTKWAAKDVEGGTKLTWNGVFSEATSSASTNSFGVKTELVGEAMLDERGDVLTLFTESHSTSTSVQLVGHTRWMALSSRWKEGDSTEPADMPPTRLP